MTHSQTEELLDALKLHGKGEVSLSRETAKQLLNYITRQDEKIWALSEDNMLRGIEITELKKVLSDSSLQLPTNTQQQLTESRQFSTRRLRKLIS